MTILRPVILLVPRGKYVAVTENLIEYEDYQKLCSDYLTLLQNAAQICKKLEANPIVKSKSASIITETKLCNSSIEQIMKHYIEMGKYSHVIIVQLQTDTEESIEIPDSASVCLHGQYRVYENQQGVQFENIVQVVASMLR